MSDINSYANEQLLDFMDAMHSEIRRVLEGAFEGGWLEEGVFKHFSPDYFFRMREMLESPMRVVDMGKTAEDLYGIEHMWQIISGNWSHFRGFFGSRAEEKKRVEVIFGEITELRHNISHRRGNHLLRRIDLIRFLDNCNKILSAIGSNEAVKFNESVDLLSNGASPWGEMLYGWIPPSDEMYDEFIGRSTELDGLSKWLASDSYEVAIHGYGGIGKSALAHRFAREVKLSSYDDFIAVCWVSAKDKEFVAGSSRDRMPDFVDLDGLLQAIWVSLYGPGQLEEKLTPELLAKELNDMPILLVIDDFNTVLSNLDIYNFLRFKLRGTKSRLIYTSRDYVQGMSNLEVPAFSDIELAEFISQKCHEYGIHDTLLGEWLKRVEAVRRVTDGYPLFVNDLIRYSITVGIDHAISDWQHRKGDDARQYALKSQMADRTWLELLIAFAQTQNSLTASDITKYSGLAREDISAGIESLKTKQLINEVWNDDSISREQLHSKAYRMNANTARLVRQTYFTDVRLLWEAIETRYKNYYSDRQSPAEKKAVDELIHHVTKPSVSLQEGIDYLNEKMTGELKLAPDLHSMLGWLYSKRSPNHYKEAIQAFNDAHHYGSKKIDAYYHWAGLEEQMAISSKQDPQAIAKQWEKCVHVCRLGIERCGESRALSYKAGLAAYRQAGVWVSANEFKSSDSSYDLAIFFYRKSLGTPQYDRFPVADGAIYRGLVLALEGLGKFDEAVDEFYEWFKSRSDSDSLRREYHRMRRQYREFANIRSRKSQNLAQELNSP